MQAGSIPTMDITGQCKREHLIFFDIQFKFRTTFYNFSVVCVVCNDDQSLLNETLNTLMPYINNIQQYG